MNQTSNEPKFSESDSRLTDQTLFVVGIGASAGGIQALQSFFSQTQKDAGIAYVVILHLSPDHDSQLADVLRSHCVLPVEQVVTITKILPDHVYVIPPNHHLVMNDGHIEVRPNLLVQERRAPVDIFFRTLAHSHGPAAACVILTGTGGNGSMGLKHIKEFGGAVFVQDPNEAEYNDMPRNALATGMVDQVLPVSAIPGRLRQYFKKIVEIEIPESGKDIIDAHQRALREILNHIRARTGHNFLHYKRASLLRRIERRVGICNQPDLVSYADYLVFNQDEVKLLLKDLLISVTHFFRDIKTFEALESSVIPSILENKTQGDEIRIWVAGCATGEEAYSMAMLMAERTLDTLAPPRVQIFATDIDESAIAFARNGFYNINAAADISPERLRRFFIEEDAGYRIRREVREMVLFANHNFLKDPPFSRIDLISCRNVLIYLDRFAQDRALESFHFALKPGGFLCLGSSESAENESGQYSAYIRDQQIYRARDLVVRTFPIPDPPSFDSFDRRATAVPSPDSAKRARVGYNLLHQRLLESYAPPSVVVNHDYDIMHLTDNADQYLQINGGELSNNLMSLIVPDLRLELRSALFQAFQQQGPIDTGPLMLKSGGGTSSVIIQVRPVINNEDPAAGFALVLFQPAEPDASPPKEAAAKYDRFSLQLDEELNQLRTKLSMSIEQHEFHAEELRASNEELQAMNEELRSSSEELETSKEELQSINEELRTVNQELKVKIEETSQSSNKLKNLINSSSIGTIFLDRALCIAMFTPAAREIFHLIPSDIGRPLFDITSKLHDQNVLSDAEAVLANMQVIEREVQVREEIYYLMRLIPYRTAEDKIEGVVITFVNITERRQHERRILASERRQAFLLALGDELRQTADPERTMKSACIMLARQLSASAAFYSELAEDSAMVVIHEGYNAGPAPFHGVFAAKELVSSIRIPFQTGKEVVINEIVPDAGGLLDGIDGATVAAVIAVPVLKAGRTIAVLNVCQNDPRNWTEDEVNTVRDVAERTWAAVEQSAAEWDLRTAQQQLLTTLEATQTGTCVWDLDADKIVMDENFCKLLGLPAGTAPESPGLFLGCIDPADRDKVHAAMTAATSAETRIRVSFHIIAADTGAVRWMQLFGRKVKDGVTPGVRVLCVMHDVSD